MGKAIKYTCPICKNSKRLCFGVGKFSCSEEFLIGKEMNYSLTEYCDDTCNLDKNEILEILKNETCHLNEDFRYKMYICPKCNNGDTFFEFVLYTEKHGEIVPKYKCKHCGEIMEEADEGKDYKLFCDFCNNEINLDELNTYCVFLD